VGTLLLRQPGAPAGRRSDLHSWRRLNYGKVYRKHEVAWRRYTEKRRSRGPVHRPGVPKGPRPGSAWSYCLVLITDAREAGGEQALGGVHASDPLALQGERVRACPALDAGMGVNQGGMRGPPSPGGEAAAQRRVRALGGVRGAWWAKRYCTTNIQNGSRLLIRGWPVEPATRYRVASLPA